MSKASNTIVSLAPLRQFATQHKKSWKLMAILLVAATTSLQICSPWTPFLQLVHNPTHLQLLPLGSKSLSAEQDLQMIIHITSKSFATRS